MPRGEPLAEDPLWDLFKSLLAAVPRPPFLLALLLLPIVFMNRIVRWALPRAGVDG